jgi:hypothetical protein
LSVIAAVALELGINPGAGAGREHQTDYKRAHRVIIANRGGEGGIRTLDTLAGILLFESSAFNRSATSPTNIVYAYLCNFDKLVKSIDIVYRW